jgi:hypothetical protein
VEKYSMSQPLRFGIGIPVLAQYNMTQTEYERLRKRIASLSPYIRDLRLFSWDHQPEHQTASPADTYVRKGQRLWLALMDEYTVALRSGGELPQFTVDANFHPKNPRFSTKKLRDKTPSGLFPWLAHQWSQWLSQAKSTQPYDNTTELSPRKTQTEMAMYTQDRLLEIFAPMLRQYGLLPHWPARQLPYNWRGFIMPQQRWFYPAQHSANLVNPVTWSTEPTDIGLQGRHGQQVLQAAVPYVYESEPDQAPVSPSLSKVL